MYLTFHLLSFVRKCHVYSFPKNSSDLSGTQDVLNHHSEV